MRSPVEPGRELTGLDPTTTLYLIGRIDRWIQTELARQLDNVGLTVAQFTVLAVLSRRPGLSNAALARRSLISPQATATVLASLEERGLAVRWAAPDHGRIKNAHITDQGASVLNEATGIATQLEDAMLADLGDADRRGLEASLGACMQTLSDGRRVADTARGGRLASR